MGIIRKRCVIIGSGDCSIDFLKSNIKEDDYIICADGGYNYALSADLSPDLLIGDFDSIDKIPDFNNIIKLPIEKDITDCEAAFLEGKKIGFTSFVVFGGTGGRFEHTYANISVMANAVKQGLDFTIVDEKHIFNCVYNSLIKIPFKKNTQISVFAFGGNAYNVTERGFHYSLDNATLKPFEPLGISNDIVSDYGVISVEDGSLLVIETKM